MQENKPILLKVTADYILECPRLQEKAITANKEQISEAINEWLRKEAAVKGWSLKKLWHYYKVEYRSYTTVIFATLTTHIQPYLKGRGGRQKKGGKK